METSGEGQELPQFPLAAYRGLSQTLPLSLEDGHCSEEIVCSNVRILASTNSPRKTSTMLTLKTEVDFLWEDRYYAGQLVAVHWTGMILAYVIIDRETRDGVVRVTTKKSGGRALIKGMKGCVHDLGFSQTENEILLAIIDEQGTLFVYQMEEKGTLFSTRLVFQLKNDVKPKPDYSCRVIWMSHAPEEEPEDQRLLAVLIGHQALLCHIGQLQATYLKNSGEFLFADKLEKEDLQVIEGHTDDIMFAEFAPDASALATVSLDGTMQFFQVYMGERPKCLHNWRPHDGKPLSFLSFLDNNKECLPDGKFWKFVVTGANNNTELKVWNCSHWELIQTITISSEGQKPKLKAALDESASFLVLSDQVNRIVYLYKVCCSPDVSSAHIQSVAAYVVPFSILSFVITDVTFGNFGKSDDESDLDDSADEEEIGNGTVLTLALIHSKSFQDCRVQFLPPKKLKLTTLVPDQPELPPPFTLMTPSECASTIKVENELSNVLEEITATEAVVSGASSPSQEVCEILNPKEISEAARSLSSDLIIPGHSHNGYELPKNDEILLPTNEVTVPKESSVFSKNDEVIESVSINNAPIYASFQDLQQRVQCLEQSQGVNTADLLNQLFDTQVSILKALEKREAVERARNDAMLASLSKSLESTLNMKIKEILPGEVKKQLVPVVSQSMDNIKRTVHAEIRQQTSTTDQLLKENIAKLVQNKSVMESLSASVSSSVRNSISETCKDLMMNFVLPRMEKMLEKTFLQVNESFGSGLREFVAAYREETDKVRDGIKHAESSLRQATDLNKKALNALPGELEKSLLSIGNQINKQLTDTLQKELTSSIVDQGPISRAMTPAMVFQEKRQVIAQLLAAEQYNSAFQEALSASDLNLVVYTCEKVRADQLFLASTTCPLQQPVLLSLIQQLTTDLRRNSELKSSYLMEAVLRLEVHHDATREFLPKVISEVERNISNYLATHPKESKVSNELTRTLMIVKLLSGQTRQ